MKKAILISILTIGVIFTFILYFSLMAVKKPVTGQFRFAFAGIADNGNIIPITQKTLPAGLLQAKIQIFFQPVKNTYLYMLLLDNEYDLTLLFPGSNINAFYRNFDNYGDYYIPGDMSLGDLIQEGREYKLHMLFSVKRLFALEKELQRYFSSGDTARKQGAKKIVKILQNILLAADTAPEKRIPIMGTERSAENLLKEYAEEFYFRSSLYEIYAIKRE